MSGYFECRLFCDWLLCMEAILCLATLNGGYFVTGYFEWRLFCDWLLCMEAIL